ncbi:thiol-disulfide isomerase/thioredoxin [Chryseobacterium rhizosphaerae]|uniref:TlpA family protein disulfide reductase n=1 Tax=Chryseobacterium rhizosphaerae TaxID=395937 RepID=UPI0028625609|nr:TlpA disulfide reductase family protein [Chryseobacterium rhizosphaerae]MDR6546484.1 thiol-disulfide isomerase/thioredoxin [Chryseobacterium rhizosphaerae]
MKTNILIIILSCFCFSLLGQVKTKLTGYIPEYKEITADVELNVFLPHVVGSGRKVDYKTRTLEGKFEFEIEISEPLSINANVNEKHLFFPGAYSILVNPGDSIHIKVADVKKSGLLSLTFSGKGSEKVVFQQAVVNDLLALYKEDPDYSSQSIGYKFRSTDKKLSVIDSICKNYKGEIKNRDRDLIKAMEYEAVLDMFMYSCIHSKSDSLNMLFKKFIVKKNWMQPFLEGNNIRNYGLSALREFVILSEYANPVNSATGIRTDSPVTYGKLVIKHLSKYAAAKEYLLASVALNVFADEQASENSKLIYQLYSDNVNHDSPFYSKVRDRYQFIMSNLQKGMQFYPFSLPDTTGKIHHLADFKGKVIILDFWFNGCGGCRQLAPIMEELEKEYVGKEIQFISISIDSKKSLWLNGIGKYCSKSSMQLFTEGLETKHPLVKFLNPGGYPFLVAIDKNGNLIGPPPIAAERKAEFKRFIDPFL